MSKDSWRLATRSPAKLRLAVTVGLIGLGLFASGQSPLGPGSAHAATTLTVNTTEDIAADLGADGDCSLRAAVLFANNPATADLDCGTNSGGSYTIVLDGGSTYLLTVAGEDDTALGGDLDIAGGVQVAIVVNGLNDVAVQQTVEDRVFQVAAGASLSLDRITVTGGNLGGPGLIGLNFGGGIHNAGSFTLTGGTVIANTVDRTGGGIYSTGDLTILDSLVSGNFARLSGGGIAAVEGSLTVTRSEVSGNTTDDTGGGIANSRQAGFGATIVITDSIISNNLTDFGGGGIDNLFGSLTLVRSVVSNNIANFGGGIWNTDAASITNSLITGNQARSRGGGIVTRASAVMTLMNTTVSDNEAIAGTGGGIENEAILTIADSVVGGNRAALHGGGIYNTRDGTLRVDRSAFDDNLAGQFGGGISNDGVLTVTNSALTRNAATFGGGMDNFGTATLANVTVSGNEAAEEGGGIYIDEIGVMTLTNVTLAFNEGATAGIHSDAAPGAVALANTIVTGNGPVDCTGAVTSLGHNLDSDGTCFDGSVAGDIPVGVALLGALVDNGGPTWTHGLLPGSQAIDAGDGAVCSAPPVNGRDQRGVARPQDGNDDGVAVCDIGAYEAEPTDGINNTNNNVIDLDNDNDNTNGNDNANSNNNANNNDNQNANANENEQDQDNGQGQDNANEQQNNIDSSPAVNIDWGD